MSSVNSVNMKVGSGCIELATSFNSVSTMATLRNHFENFHSYRRISSNVTSKQHGTSTWLNTPPISRFYHRGPNSIDCIGYGRTQKSH
jgi:hypothetical protein